MTFQNKGFGKISSAQLDSHGNSAHNGMVESFPAATATIFMNFLDSCFEGVSLGGLCGRSLGNLWEASTIIEKLSNLLGRLQKVPGNVDFTIFLKGRRHKLLFSTIEAERRYRGSRPGRL